MSPLSVLSSVTNVLVDFRQVLPMSSAMISICFLLLVGILSMSEMPKIWITQNHDLIISEPEKVTIGLNVINFQTINVENKIDVVSASLSRLA